MPEKVRVRGSIWISKSNVKAVGSYAYAFREKHDRFFVLTYVTGKTKVYESPEAAKADGWKILVRKK